MKGANSMTYFTQLLFDLEDQTCFTDTPYGIRPSSVVNAEPTEYFCINALKGARRDENVAKHRTFLIEFDNAPLSEQCSLIKVPYTARVFSGNKSYHFFITLTEPVSAEKYTELAKRLHLLMPDADPSTKNPSRLGRLPGVIRQSTGKIQEFEYMGERISLEKLELYLPPLPVVSPKTAEVRAMFISSLITEAKNFPTEVMNELGLKGRNNFFHWFGQRMIENNMPLSQRLEFVDIAYNNLRDKSQFDLSEARHAARVSK